MMVVIVVRRVRPSVRGNLARWMIEVAPGVFAGSLSARVRDRLWEAVRAARRQGTCAMVHSARNEQGFVFRSEGASAYESVEVEGLFLVRRRGHPTGPHAP
jgi:CRISPR-associated protein Cas2